MVQYYEEYEFETSPRKLEPDFEPNNRRKKVQKQRVLTEEDKKKAKLKEARKNARIIVDIIIGFTVLLIISYRYALINSKLTQKESLKAELAAIQKQNAQIQVSIEQGMNINNIEQEAKERLGMQKLDNTQKVYVSLQKKDYTESSKDTVTNTDDESWWQKFLKTIKGE